MTDPTDPARAIALFKHGDIDAARAAAHNAIIAGGESAQMRHLLGLACCRAGDLAEGINHLERAAALAPRDPNILVMLMRALIDADRPREALSRPFEAAGLGTPALLALWRTRAEAAHRAQDAYLEAEALQRAVLLDPADHEFRERLVPMLMSLDQPAQALAQIDALPRSPWSRRARSMALVALRRLDEAAAIEAALLDADPRDRDAWRSALLIADRQNDLATLSAMVEFGELSGYLQSEIAFARALIAKQQGQWDEALTLANASDVAGDPARRFALIASLADRLGRADEAFGAATAKAAATNDCSTWRSRGERHRLELERLVTAMTDEWATSWAPSPPRARPAPAFLIGFPRSGTTLLDTFLMGHRDVVVIEEELMLAAAARVLGESAALDGADPAKVENARAAYFAELDRHLPSGEPPRLIIDKLPLAMTGAPIIHRLFPDAKIIFAVRHPADSVLSNFLQSFKLNDAMANFLDLGDAAHFYNVAMRVWTRTNEVFRLNTRDLIYEQLVENPEAALRPLVEWLGLPWDQALLDHRRTAAARGVIVTPSYDQVTQPLHRRAVGRWRRYETHLAPVRGVIEPWAIRLGYGAMTPSS